MLDNLPNPLPLITTSPAFVVFPNNKPELEISVSDTLKNLIKLAGFIAIVSETRREKGVSRSRSEFGVIAKILNWEENPDPRGFPLVKMNGLIRIKIISIETIQPSLSEPPYYMATWEKIPESKLDNALWQDPEFQNKFANLKRLLKEHHEGLCEFAKNFNLYKDNFSNYHLEAVKGLDSASLENFSENLDKAIMVFSSGLRERVREMSRDLNDYYLSVRGEKLFRETLTLFSKELVGLLGESATDRRLDKTLELFEKDRKVLQGLKEGIARSGITLKGGGGMNNGSVGKFRKIFEEKKEKIPDEAKIVIERELSRLEKTPEQASEYYVVEKYVETLLDIPWGKYTPDETGLVKIKLILDEDHWGLAEAKERIVEFMAAKSFNPKKKAPILHFDGPPGTGKTSLGKSIARALGRKFVRMSVGGIDDEAEIRGHRSTYVGAKSGRIIDALIRAGTSNPVIMIDEVDKLGQSIHGDPASALLEALDPEQNFSFNDNYIATGVDLSQVLFITTSNNIEKIPRPLLDRMETIEFSSYTEDEKVHIAEKFIIPKKIAEFNFGPDSETLREKNLLPFELSFDQDAISEIINEWTVESGVRDLERKIDAILRKIARKILETGQKTWKIIKDDLELYFDKNKRKPKKHVLYEEVGPGVAPMLAVSDTGEGQLLYVESIIIRKADHRKVKVTGVDPFNEGLGRMIEESVDKAWDFLFKEFGVLSALDIEKNIYLHVSFANGGLRKDGPSAGISILWALYSLFTGQPVKSGLVATGEITLGLGKAFPIGAVKEKVLAAARAGAKEVVIPKANEEDISKVPEDIRQKIKIIPCETMEEALKIAFPNYPELPERTRN